MKKIIIASAIAAIAITGCATKTPNDVTVATTSAPSSETTVTKTNFNYVCTENATVKVKYKPELDSALLTVNAPSWKLNNQAIEMDAAPSASGSLFVNNTNPSSLYSWHAKANEGALSVVIGKKEYILDCKAR